MSVCLIIHAGPMLRSNANEDLLEDIIGVVAPLDRSFEEEQQPSQVYLLPMTNEHNTEHHTNPMFNFQRNRKSGKLNLHTNLNLPRYLRHVD